MAGFATHVSVSGGLGIIYGTAGYACGLSPTTALVGATLCTIGGMLPDLDGDTGVAVREIVPLVATVIPILMLDIFQHWGWDQESIFLSIVCLYLFIRFGVGEPFKRWTRHRGMWHSIPAAINCGLICMIICAHQEVGPRFFKATAITLGFLSHLVLDELWSIDLLRFRIKNSLGTAFKLFSRKRMWPNVLTYGLMAAFIAILSMKDPDLQSNFRKWRESGYKMSIVPDWSRFRFANSPSSEVEDNSDEVRVLPAAKPREIQTGSEGLSEQ